MKQRVWGLKYPIGDQPSYFRLPRSAKVALVGFKVPKGHKTKINNKNNMWTEC